MACDELFMDERNHDVCFRKDEEQKYAIVIMYEVTGDMPPKFITSQALSRESVYPKLEKMLNDWEQGRVVCLNSHFINPKKIISIKVDLFKEKYSNFFKKEDNFDGEYYS